MTLLFSNNAETTIATGITPSSTSISVVPTKGLLFNQAATVDAPERVTLTDGVHFEVVEITGWTADTATVVRGVEGVALDWPVGTLFSSRITAGVLSLFTQKNYAALEKGFLLVPNTATSLDLGVLYPNPDLMPSLLIVDYGTDINLLNITLPPITGSPKAYRLDVWKPISGTKEVRIHAVAADYMDNVLGDWNNLLNSTHMQLLGHNGRWDAGYI